MKPVSFADALAAESKQATCSQCGADFETFVDSVTLCDDCSLQADLAQAREEEQQRRDAELAYWRKLEDDPQRFWSEQADPRSVPAKHRPGLTEIELDQRVASWTGEPWSVTFQGPNGRGKTWSAARTLSLVLARQRSSDFAWWRCGALVVELKRAIGDELRTARLLDTLRARVLVLDDLRALRETDFAVDILREALMHREEWMLPTIVTIDAPLSTVEPRLESRLRGGIVVGIDGEDRRRRQ